jgi:hypothetical protein
MAHGGCSLLNSVVDAMAALMYFTFSRSIWRVAEPMYTKSVLAILYFLRWLYLL